jgi:hypothetical protein
MVSEKMSISFDLFFPQTKFTPEHFEETLLNSGLNSQHRREVCYQSVDIFSEKSRGNSDT